MKVSIKKRLLARMFQLFGISQGAFALQPSWYGPFIRAVNYHSTPASSRTNFAQQLEFYRQHFCAVGYEDVLALHRGTWHKPKPGLLISFDDGLRDNAEVAAPLLEEFGFVGWFFVPVGFLDTPDDQQAAFARAHRIGTGAAPTDTDRQAMSWEQLRRLAGRHVVGCHTQHHTRLRPGLSEATLEQEVILPKRRLEQMLGREVFAFGWVGGEEWAYSREAAAMVRRAGFQLGFMTNTSPILPGQDLQQLQRTNIEADWPLEMVRFQLSGCLDLLYTGKRRRVNRLTACPEDAPGLGDTGRLVEPVRDGTGEPRSGTCGKSRPASSTAATGVAGERSAA